MAFIELNNITVDIPIFDAARSLRKTMFASATGGSIRQGEHNKLVRALENIDLKLTEGDRLGLIGHNGSGKTTLLRVMSGLYEPSAGIVRQQGRIIPLINPAVGMDGDKTGIENIQTIGLFLGMTPKEVRQKMDGIIDYTELGEFVYMPVRTYSAGMMVRLVFSVATALEPEILLMDEGIGAGDARFAEKAKERLDQFYEKTKCIVLASHSDEMIRNLCNKAILLEHGRIVASGDVESVLHRYHNPPAQ